MNTTTTTSGNADTTPGRVPTDPTRTIPRPDPVRVRGRPSSRGGPDRGPGPRVGDAPRGPDAAGHPVLVVLDGGSANGHPAAGR